LPPRKESAWREAAPYLGCSAGGCVVPFGLLMFCGYVLGDTGGPLFWPILAGFTGMLGLVIGLAIRARR